MASKEIIEHLKSTDFEDINAFNNLAVLARDSPKSLLAHDELLIILRKSIDKKKPEVTESCLRILSLLAKVDVFFVINNFSIDSLIDILPHCGSMSTFQYLVQTIINSLAGVQEMLNKMKDKAKLDKDRTLSVSESICILPKKKVDDELVKSNEETLFNIIIRLIRRAVSYIISAASRDCLLALVMSNIDYQGLNFGVKLVKEGCIQNLLDIAAEVEDLKNPSSMEISAMTHTLVAAILEKIYSCHDNDNSREIFRQKVQEYLDKLLRNPDMNDKIRATKLFTVLLSGPAEIGNSCVGQSGMIEMIIAMAGSDEFAMQKGALDAIIAASSKKDKCTAFAKLGEKVLNELRESKNEEIRLRALVGLSKISSVGSTDASIRPFSQGANLSFAKDCRAIITRPTPEFSLKQYAIEALAYLSFDGDVKEELVADTKALEALFDTLTFDINSPVTYSILNIFVNLTNSYEKQEHSPELLELAKFAQQHIPEEHAKDKRDVLENRLKQLALSELVPALVQLTKIESKAAKELLGRIMNALCEIEPIRGRLVQQGAVKLLMNLTHSESKPPEKYCLLAAQALARLGITINPDFVYPGQRLIAVIKPLKKLLSPDCNALQNFEGLLALTNIAQTNESARIHILNEGGFSLIEALMFEDHELVRRAAVQCVVNLIREPQMVSLYEAENDRVKYLVILCQEEDVETVKAASGALAMLCQVSEKACERLFSAKQWYEILMLLLSNENVELVHRAAVIINCIVHCENTKLAERVFESKLFEVLVALTLPQVDTVPESIKSIAGSILKLGKQRNLIKDASAIGHIEEDESD